MKTDTAITRSIRRGILAFGILALTSVTAHAAVVTWSGAQGVTGDSDVSTAGTLVGALNIGNTGVASPTVNGVTFTGLAMPGGTTNVTSGNFNLTSPGISFASNTQTTAFAPFSNLSAGYQTLLSSIAGGSSSGPIVLTMSGLVLGRSYQFEWWSSNSVGGPALTTATAGNAVSLNANPTSAQGGLGQFATGAFVADAATQAITFTGAGSSPLINGFQLRLLPASAVPEPGSALAGMLALGVCLSGLGRRNRRQSAAA